MAEARDALALLSEMRRGNPPTYIYAIQAGGTGPVKIGLTNSPRARLKTLQTASPWPLKGIALWCGAAFEEKLLHEMFAESRLEGEWFQPSPELLDTLAFLGAGEACEWHDESDCLVAGTDPPQGTCMACGIQFI
jgi:hypothetical protein